MRFLLTALLSALLILATDAFSQRLAEPGAPGPGRFATGGRGGVVAKVTNLNDSGAGSLREALTNSGSRNIIFTTGGTITLLSPINVDNPNYTVIGETAPGEGIQVTGDFIRWRAGNGIVTGMRLRPGDDVGGSRSDPSERDAVYIHEDADVFYMSHCSAAGGTDLVFSIWDGAPGPGADDVTIAHAFVGEPYHINTHPNGPHGKGFDITRSGDVGFYNVYGHSLGFDRLPQLLGVTGTRIEIQNLIVYNFGSWGATIDGPGLYSLEGLKYVIGPDDDGKRAVFIDSVTVGEPVAVYVANSTGPNRLFNTGDQWYPATGGRFVFGPQQHNGVVYYSSSPPFNWPPTYRVRDVDGDAVEHALRWAGAILPKRDAMDQRWIDEYNAGTGAIPNGTQVRTLYFPSGTVTSATSNTMTFSLTTDVAGTNRYNGLTLEITGGTGFPQANKTITATSGTNPVTVTISGTFSPALDGTTTFRIHQPIVAPVAAIPTLQPGTAPTDTDGGGIPDNIETILGINPAVASDDDDLAPDGFSYVEKWRNYLYTINIPER